MTDQTHPILDHIADLLDWHEDLYRDLHAHPELSFAEHRTAEKVASRLTELGYQVQTGIGGTGVVGVLSNGEGSCVLARADFDALPVKEDTDAEFASTVVAKEADGNEVPVMHACGHDFHTAALLAAAQLMAEHTDAWSGTFVALFQPAEEVGAGATAMIEDGLVDKIPAPDVCLGQHVGGMPAGFVGSRPGLTMSAADSVRITLFGKGTHGSMPHQGVDPILLASAIVLRLNTIVSRELAPGRFGVVTVGSLRAGSKSNVIPGSAELLVNLRSYDDQTRAHLRETVERIVRAECAASGSPREPEIDYYDPFPLTENTEDVFDKVRAEFDRHFGDRSVTIDPTTGSEDFGNIPTAFGAPSLFWFWGGFDHDLFGKDGTPGPDVPGNHNSSFLPVLEPTLRTGIEAMTVALLAYLGR